MAMDFNKVTNDLLKTGAGSKLTGKEDEINKLLDSPEGQNVKNMLSGDEANIMNALEKGDFAVLKKTLSDVLKTEDGAKLAEQIMRMMK